jgi:hypothetical protein
MEIQALRRYGAPAASSETQEERSAPSRLPYTIRGANGSPDVLCRDVGGVIKEAEHLGAVCEAHWSELVQLREELGETNEALDACQSQAGGRERAAFEAGWRALPTGKPTGPQWCFDEDDTPQQRIDEAYAAYEAQSSPSQPAETPEERKDAK